MDMTAIILTAASFFVNGGLLAWVYKVMESQMKIQKENFQHEILQLRAEIEGLRRSESRFIEKYKMIYNHFRTFKCPKNPGERCKGYEAYMEELEQKGGLL